MWVGHTLPRAAGSQGAAGARRWSATAVLLAAVGACFFYTFPASWLIGGFDNYLGLLPPNVYHNSTLVAAMPFSIAAFGLGLRQWRAGSGASFWGDALLGLVLVGCALCKPSYAFAFVPAYGVLRLLHIRHQPVGRLLTGLALAVLPVLLVIVGQAQWIARHPEVSFHGESHVALAFPAGWKMLLFLTDVDGWDSLLLGLGSFALPLLAYALRPAWLRQPAHQWRCSVRSLPLLNLCWSTNPAPGPGTATLCGR
ncbi:hypothetical protein ACFQT0_04515 [Hymenobacter humi]|uniref:Glycosyltransferase RgtA/B/C/D-like domain-containing protein n=1 Tax=Hymenobacter humi TaxID=1411620 RepID=A0ABW2U1G1_9BACT